MAAGAAVTMVGVVCFIWYYFSPKFTDVGYRPEQPLPFSHKIHAGDLKMDCRYCHSKIEEAPMANIPPTQTCMNCHKIVKRNSEKLKVVMDSWNNKNPVQWIRVHNLPDFVYFDHSVHLTAGVGCTSCHGNIREMEVVEQKQPLSMGWCLECHRDPDNHLRPREELTNMAWVPAANQAEFAAKVKQKPHFKPPTTNCSGCHR